MKNKIIPKTYNEALEIESMNKKMYIAKIDAKKVNTWEDFVDKSIEEFQMPRINPYNVDSYLDWMRDLSWLDNENGYVLFLYNADILEEKRTELFWKIEELFSNDILPFWEKDVEEFVVGGRAKKFMVYLVKER